jgi:hypothetical protein
MDTLRDRRELEALWIRVSSLSAGNDGTAAQRSKPNRHDSGLLTLFASSSLRWSCASV